MRKNLGVSYAVDKSLRREAEDLVRTLKADQSKNSRELFRLIKPSLPYIVCSTLISMLITALRSYFHQIGLWVLTIEAGAAGKTEEAFAMLFNLWVGHMLIKLIELPDFTYTRRAKSTFGNNIRNGVLSAMVRQDYEYFDRTPPGVLQDRLNRDADELGENLIGFPKDMLCHLVWIVSNMVQVYNQAPTQFFIAACCPVALMCAFQYFTFKYFRECNERARRVEEEGTAATSEVLRQIKTVRQFASEQRAAATYARRNLARMLIGERVTTFKRSLEVIVWMIFDSGITLTIILGLPYVTRGELSAGQLIDCFCKLNFNVNFCLRESLEQLPRMARLLEPMGRICDLLQAKPTIEPDAHPSYIDVNNAVELAELLDGCKVTKDTKGITRIALTSFAPVMLDTTTENAPTIGAQLVYLSSKDHRYVTPFELLAQADDDEVAAPSYTIPTGLTYPVRAIFSTKLRPSRFNGKIEFEDVHFSYPTDLRKPVLQGLSFTVEPGEKVALVGPTGCGKSSCMSLLQRLYDPNKGVIRLDDTPLAEYDLHNLRARVVIVDQNTVLFSSSIKENITYGMDRTVTEEEVIEACKRAHAWEFISEKPDKLMTYLDGGGALSGGQRQRLAIARAILRSPDVILLDEATSALDNTSEAKVQKALDELAKCGSALVIAHRLSTIKDADKIVVVDHGKAVEIGTHEELLERGMTTTAKAALVQEGAGEVTPINVSREASVTSVASSTSTATLKEGSSNPPSLQGSKDDLHGFFEEKSRAPTREASPTAPPLVRRLKSAPDGMVQTSEERKKAKGTTYKGLWDAATGASEAMSLSSVSLRIKSIEEELVSLRAKQAGMQEAKSKLIGEVEM